MEIIDLYKTIERPTEGVYKVKGSKFLAFAYPITTENEVKPLVQELKTTYYDARHHCYAWQLGIDGNLFRANDDGEPSGTAGKPILGQIRSHELTNILIVVVRYFGGIKLGTSGLIHAYKEAAADAILNAKIVKKTEDAYYDVQFAYDAMNDVMRVIKEEEPQIINQQFDLNCSMTLAKRCSQSSAMASRLGKIDTVRLTWLYNK